MFGRRNDRSSAPALAALAAAVALLPLSCGREKPRPGPAVRDYRGVLKTAPVLRVLLSRGPGKVTLDFIGPWQLTVHPGGASAAESVRRVVVQRTENGFRLADRAVAADILTFRSVQSPHIGVNGRVYPGAIRIYRMPDDTAAVVNLVDAETYLVGVVAGEMPSDWPANALKAQAVAARTYALYRRRTRREGEFDLHAGTRDQMYADARNIDPRVRRAVEETAGIVLMHRNHLFPAYYHSTCGGFTEDAQKVFSTPGLEFMRGLRCDYCRTSPRYAWSMRMPVAKALELLQAQYPKLEDIQAVRLAAPGHRVETVIVEDAHGEVSIPATRFRALLGADHLYSTYFTAHVSGGSLIFEGKGWGHGVGMCQYGARGLALDGKAYDQILKYYYRRVSLARLY